MRRWAHLLTVAVAALFVVVAVPGSPVTAWLTRVLAGAGSGAVTVVPRVPAAGEMSSPPLLRVAVGAMVTPERTYREYRGVLAAVAERSGRQLELVQRKTYREVNDLVSEGAVDLAWVCTGAFLDLAGRDTARVLAVPVVDGRRDYRSYVIVGPSAQAETFEDLRGAVFAFTDPLSLTGRRVVVDELAKRGATPEDFFSDSFFSFGHDSSMRSVRDGLADAAAVDSLVYDFFAERDREEVAGLRVIWRSERFPIPPLVVPSSTGQDAFEALQRVVLRLGDDPETRRLLALIRVDRFERGSSHVYSLR